MKDNKREGDVWDRAAAAADGGAVTVFGGTGFPGRRVAERLADLGFAVRVATRHPEQQQRPGLTSVAADVNDQASVAPVVAGCVRVVQGVRLYVARRGQPRPHVHVKPAGSQARSTKTAGGA